MDDNVKRSLWRQYGAAIDTLSHAMELCPDELWTAVVWPDDEDPRYGQFWFIVYHTLSWLDLFLTGTREEFELPAPFVRGRVPDEPYTRQQLRDYLAHGRRKCRAAVDGLTDERARRVCVFPWMEPTYLELQMYCMRHVMEHAGQLGYFLGQQGVTGMDWISQAKDE